MSKKATIFLVSAFGLMCGVLMGVALSNPVGYINPHTGECVGVWDNHNRLSRCEDVGRYDQVFTRRDIHTREQLALYLGVQLAPAISPDKG